MRVIECRKLEGNNISPMVKVSCGSQFKKTSSRKGTNRPVFDDVSLFLGSHNCYVCFRSPRLWCSSSSSVQWSCLTERSS